MSPEFSSAAAPRPVTNEFFVAGQNPTWLEQVRAETELQSYWSEMAAEVPEEADIYNRNQALVNTTLQVVSGESPATGYITDMRDRCTLYFDRLGSVNSLKGNHGLQAMVGVAGRYLELATQDKGVIDQDSTSFGRLPLNLIQTFSDPNRRVQALASMQPEEVGNLGNMFAEISRSFDKPDLDERETTMRNRFEEYALQCYQNTVERGSRGGYPNFLQDNMRKAWAGAYDIRFDRIARISDDERRTTIFRQTLGQQLTELTLLLNAGAIPERRDMDGLLYEMYLPVLLRHDAAANGIEDTFTIRKSTTREDMPIDGMTHSLNEGQYFKYSFDFMLDYPAYDRKVFLQAKIGRDTTGYDEAISVFNNHAGLPELRRHMLTATRAMTKQLRGERTTLDETKLLYQEHQRVSSLYPEEL